MTTYRAKYGGLVLWVEGSDKGWKQHVHDSAIDDAGEMLHGGPFGANVSSTQPSYPDLNSAKEAACEEATRRKHPDGKRSCEEASIVWHEVPNT
jgi:hypothetical protein